MSYGPRAGTLQTGSAAPSTICPGHIFQKQ